MFVVGCPQRSQGITWWDPANPEWGQGTAERGWRGHCCSTGKVRRVCCQERGAQRQVWSMLCEAHQGWEGQWIGYNAPTVYQCNAPVPTPTSPPHPPKRTLHVCTKCFGEHGLRHFWLVATILVVVQVDCQCNIFAQFSSISQLIGGLADEKIRWAESVQGFDEMLVNVIGDVMMSAGVVAYLGAFTVSINWHFSFPIWFLFVCFMWLRASIVLS